MNQQTQHYRNALLTTYGEDEMVRRFINREDSSFIHLAELHLRAEPEKEDRIFWAWTGYEILKYGQTREV